jgi:hypothetical protein
MTKKRTPEAINAPVLTVNLSHGNQNKIYLIEHNEWFNPPGGFGGSRHGYSDKHGATMILREVTPNATRDIAMNIFDPHTWDWIAKLINSTSGKAEAFIAGDKPIFEKED